MIYCRISLGELYASLRLVKRMKHCEEEAARMQKELIPAVIESYRDQTVWWEEICDFVEKHHSKRIADLFRKDESFSFEVRDAAVELLESLTDEREHRRVLDEIYEEIRDDVLESLYDEGGSWSEEDEEAIVWSEVFDEDWTDYLRAFLEWVVEGSKDPWERGEPGYVSAGTGN